MAKAGYDPAAMADFFQLLRGEQGRDPGKLEQFFSDHPPAADREARIRQQARTLGPVRSREVGGFTQVAAGLRRLPAAPSRQAQRRPETPRNDDRRDRREVEVRVERPSSRFERFEQQNGLFTIEHPDNWRAYASDWLRCLHRARGGRGGDRQRPGGPALRGHREPLRTLRRHGPPDRRAGAWKTPPTTSSARSSDRTRTCEPRTIRHGRSRSTASRPCRSCSPAARRSRGGGAGDPLHTEPAR